ncbi:mevalonate kinase [Candidatus Daviesbacteria bacterium]|nr:mevalonate kinase [Candidatus Daviesbacteria bacterium]
MKKITVSAPGKLMLFGEHAVVYDRPCIVTAVGQRMRATVELTDQPMFQLNAPDVKVLNYQKPMSDLGKGDIPKGAKFVEIAVKNFLTNQSTSEVKKMQLHLGGVRVTTKSEFSSEFGFGSSSASTVCTIFALSKLLGKKLSQKQIFDLSYKTVLDVQGKGSGFDIAAAIFGGTLYFVTGGKVIKPLKINSLPLIIGYSGIKVDTVSLIDEVKEKREKYPFLIENIYDQIQKIVEQAKITILNKDWVSLGELMNVNEGYLSTLGVEGKKLADMIYSAREAGAYGAKLSGAGIGDCMISLAPPSKAKAIKKAITQAGGKVLDVKTNVEGVRVESRV